MDGVDKKNTLYFLAILEGNTIIPLTPEEPQNIRDEPSYLRFSP